MPDAEEPVQRTQAVSRSISVCALGLGLSVAVGTTVALIAPRTDPYELRVYAYGSYRG